MSLVSIFIAVVNAYTTKWPEGLYSDEGHPKETAVTKRVVAMINGLWLMSSASAYHRNICPAK